MEVSLPNQRFLVVIEGCGAKVRPLATSGAAIFALSIPVTL